jgi:hypothetical protein
MNYTNLHPNHKTHNHTAELNHHMKHSAHRRALREAHHAETRLMTTTKVKTETRRSWSLKGLAANLAAAMAH